MLPPVQDWHEDEGTHKTGEYARDYRPLSVAQVSQYIACCIAVIVCVCMQSLNDGLNNVFSSSRPFCVVLLRCAQTKYTQTVRKL